MTLLYHFFILQSISEGELPSISRAESASFEKETQPALGCVSVVLVFLGIVPYASEAIFQEAASRRPTRVFISPIEVKKIFL